MGLLEKNQRQEIRFQKGDFVFYEPDQERRNFVMEKIKENMSITNGLDAEVELTIKNVRVIMRYLTNIGDAYNNVEDEKFMSLIDGGNRDLALLKNEVKNYIIELMQDIQEEQYNAICIGNSMIKAIESEAEILKIQQGLDKVFKKNGMDVTWQDLIKYKDDPEMLEKLLKPKAKGKGKKKTSPKKK